MGGIVEIGGQILARANAKSDIAAQNIANMGTIGYKSRASFDEALRIDTETLAPAHIDTDFSGGKLINTGNKTDLAIAGNGFFVVGSGKDTAYTRNGQFVVDSEGNLATSDGLLLQVDGHEIDFRSDRVSIDRNGAIMRGDEVVGQIRLVDFDDPTKLKAIGNGRFSAATLDPRAVDSQQISQGALEASNSSTTSDMLTIMAAVRSAETGQRIVQLYDELMAEAAANFGQG